MTSQELFTRAQRVIPGGVNSPVRAFKSVEGTPVFMVKGSGALLTTADGRELIDFCGSWGPLILGHARREVVEAACAAAADGMTFGAATPREVEFAELLCELVPSLDMVRLVSSGTEAVMTALRIARGATGRRKTVKFAGCYHGHTDSMLVSAGSGLLTGGATSSAGVSEGVASEVFVAPYNDLAAVERIMGAHGGEIAAVIVEPVAANMGLVPPKPGFLEGLRAVTKKHGALLILDEVITGFRFGPTTYGALNGIVPDLTTLGKIIGGGMPLAAVGGRKDVMKCLAPLGPVYQAGTLSGNPVAVGAGMATLRILKEENPYPRIAALCGKLAAGLNRIAKDHGKSVSVVGLESLFTPFFMASAPADYDSAKKCDTKAYAAFFHAMLNAGIYLPPSQFEVGFVSAAHTEEHVASFLNAAEKWSSV